MGVADILDVDDVNQAVDLDLIIAMSWTDRRLAGLIGCRLGVTQIWFPDATVFNSSQLRAERTNAQNQVVVGPDGAVTYLQRLTGTISSYHNLRDFPFDHQAFKFAFGSLRDSADEVVFVAEDAASWLTENPNLEGWRLEGISLGSERRHFAQVGRDISVLTLTISAQRDTDYYLFRVLLLLLVVVAMSWVVFWVPPEKYEFQIGLGATSMLTAIAFNLSIGGSLPRLGYLTTLDKIVIAAIAMIFLAIVESLVTGSLAMAGRNKQARMIDRVARVAFPLFLLVVWGGLILSTG